MADDDADGDGGEYFRWHALNEACENNANEITFALLQQFSPTSREEEAQGMPRPHTKAIKKKGIRRNRTPLRSLQARILFHLHIATICAPLRHEGPH